MIAVVLQRGPAWDPRLPLAEQAGFGEHVALITSLLNRGVAIEAGPFSDPSALGDEDLLALALLDLDSLGEAGSSFTSDSIVTGEVVALHVHAWGGTALRRGPG
jgi:hypothetical protein